MATANKMARDFGPAYRAGYYIAATLPPGLADSCRENPNNGAGDCGLILAIDEGKIPPGEYSDQELHDAVAAAGYTFDPEGGE